MSEITQPASGGSVQWPILDDITIVREWDDFISGGNGDIDNFPTDAVIGKLGWGYQSLRTKGYYGDLGAKTGFEQNHPGLFRIEFSPAGGENSAILWLPGSDAVNQNMGRQHPVAKAYDFLTPSLGLAWKHVFILKLGTTNAPTLEDLIVRVGVTQAQAVILNDLGPDTGCWFQFDEFNQANWLLENNMAAVPDTQDTLDPGVITSFRVLTLSQAAGAEVIAWAIQTESGTVLASGTTSWPVAFWSGLGAFIQVVSNNVAGGTGILLDAYGFQISGVRS